MMVGATVRVLMAVMMTVTSVTGVRCVSPHHPWLMRTLLVVLVRNPVMRIHVGQVGRDDAALGHCCAAWTGHWL